ncbi:MAG: fibrobacter succinogenes major paralogous domain-containing protein [Fibromonadales bacterium]|nr:fibrobacter succinogenes major paralogous domain-containing protein [Fibromonadales bacterium]
MKLKFDFLAAGLVLLSLCAYADESAGTFTDTRDEKTYKTVKIGTKTWMAENLNIKTDGSLCYNEDEANCEKYGRLYEWKEALEACPAGWHLSSRQDWSDLITKMSGYKGAGTKLKATSGWDGSGNGADDYGFSALPGGYRNSKSVFSNAGNKGYWWTNNGPSKTKAYYRGMSSDKAVLEETVSIDESKQGSFFSVRCVAD